MINKLFEIRDDGTFFPLLAIKMEPTNDVEEWLLQQAGYASKDTIQVVQINCGSGGSHCDLYDWPNRTMKWAHNYIQKNFDSLNSGDVIDVEYTMGFTAKPKVSERLTRAKL